MKLIIIFYKREAQININLSHENILKYSHYQKIQNDFYIYMEYMSMGSIVHQIEKQGHFSEAKIQNYTLQILKGLSFLHSKKIIHKDLKGQNILLSSSNLIKLSDFGCSISLEKTLSSSQQQSPIELLEGSVLWMAPEVVLQTKQGRKSDIWSLGCTIIEMLSGRVPWEE